VGFVFMKLDQTNLAKERTRAPNIDT